MTFGHGMPTIFDNNLSLLRGTEIAIPPKTLAIHVTLAKILLHPLCLSMAANSSTLKEATAGSIPAAARALAKKANLAGQGRGNAFYVRVTPAVESMLRSAKAPRQSMVEFLKECAITVSLQRMAESQQGE